MAAQPGDQPESLAEELRKRLLEHGHAFGMMSAARLAELLWEGKGRLGGGAHPDLESVAFDMTPSFTFPANELESVDELVPGEGACSPRAHPGRVALKTTGFGLYGNRGVLPRTDTELIFEWEREAPGDERGAYKAFLDILNHRCTALYFRAAMLRRVPFRWESGDRDRARIANWFRSLAGLYGVPDESTGFSPLELGASLGLLVQRQRSAAGLLTFVRTQFVGLELSLEQFLPSRIPLGEDLKARLEPEGGSRLGVDCVIGSSYLSHDLRFRVKLGPLPWNPRPYRGENYGVTDFLPGSGSIPEGRHYERIWKIIRLYAGAELDFDIQVGVRAGERPPRRITWEGGPRLGMTTWLVESPTAPLGSDNEDIVLQADYWQEQQA